MIHNVTVIVMSVLLFALAGGWLSRMAGGGPPKLPWGLDQWLYGLPYALITLPVTFAFGALALRWDERCRKYIWVAILLPYAGAVAGKRTGHGGGIDAGTWTGERDDEALEFLIKPLHGKISEYWYDMMLLAVTGLVCTLIAGIMVMFVDVWGGLALMLSGSTKAPAYMIGWWIYPTGSGKGIPHLNEATAIGEFLTGFFAYAILGCVAYRLFFILSGSL